MPVIRRSLSVLVALTGTLVCVVVFLVGAPVAVGAEFKEPIGTVCVDPWVESHPGDSEPDVDGSWSWWPPGITCTHAGGEVFVRPDGEDTRELVAFGLLVAVLGMGPTILVAVSLWPSRQSGEAGHGRG